MGKKGSKRPSEPVLAPVVPYRDGILHRPGKVGALRRPDAAARRPSAIQERENPAPPFLTFLLLLICLFAPLSSAFAAVVNYDIVYVRQPRYGDSTNTIWPEVFHLARLDPGADLVLLHPDGSSEVLVAGGNGGVTDPFISFDGQWCYYVFFPDLRQSALNGQRGDLQAGQSYVLQSSTDLTAWSPVSTNQMASNSFQLLIPVTNGAQKFYRALRNQP